MLDEDVLLIIGRVFGIIGLLLFVLSGVGGVLMASRTVQQINLKFLRGKIFKYHRIASIIGAVLILSFVLYKITDMISPLRVTEDQELEGLDLSQHGETAMAEVMPLSMGEVVSLVPQKGARQAA